jgi:6-phosphogluconate dehydrogenase
MTEKPEERGGRAPKSDPKSDPVRPDATTQEAERHAAREVTANAARPVARIAAGASEIGMIGLGTMGSNLVLNLADHGVPVAGHDSDPEKVRILRSLAETGNVQASEVLGEFLEAVKRPRVIMLMVPAGPVVDSVIHEVVPRLEAGDLLVDGGNSHFLDTERRAVELSERRIPFMGLGISGGADGARHGASLMPGGPREVYERVRRMLEAVAARVGSDPCVAWLGPSSSGHYTKMVHNGIEYGVMELIAETYDLLRRGLGFNNDELHEAFARWNHGELESFLFEITSRIFLKTDPETGGRLLDSIRDEAGQLGTGKWTSQAAMDLGVPVPTIDAAVTMRSISGLKSERDRGVKTLGARIEKIEGNRETILRMLENALYAAMMATYAQGFALLGRASGDRRYDLDLEAIARIWRGGCIIRSALLERIRTALHGRVDLPNILLDPDLGREVMARHEDLRSIVCVFARSGIPGPGFMSTLTYLDGYRSERLPANLIQAQRDFFGAHMYQRISRLELLHSDWNET